MKNVLVFIAVLILGSNVYAQSSCVDIFDTSKTVAEAEKAPKTKLAPKPKIPRELPEDAMTLEQLKTAAIDLTDQMSKLESSLDWWKRRTGNDERASLFNLRERRRKFKFYFETTGELYAAVNVYREVFKDVEFSFLQLKRYYKTPIAERDAYMSKEKLQEVEKIFGENYGDYLYVRYYLEGLLQTKPVDAASAEGVLYANAKYVMSHLGVPIIAERFQGLNEVLERPSIAEIEMLFRKTPGPLLAKLKRDVELEKRMLIKTSLSSIWTVVSLQKLIFKILPKRFKEPVTAFIGVNYNSYVLRRYLPDIITIVDGTTPEKQFETFRQIGAKHSSHDFYLTFARLASSSDVWISLRKTAESHKGEPIYERLLEDMKKAEADLKNYSFIPDFHKPSLIDHFTKWMIPGLVSTGTYMYADFAVIQQGVLDMYQYVSTMLPF